jgi:hypothetical protein
MVSTDVTEWPMFKLESGETEELGRRSGTQRGSRYSLLDFASAPETREYK